MPSEAMRYLRNARGTLKNAPTSDGLYADIKPVREACGTAYLAVLMAVDEYLVRKGAIVKKKPPRSVEGYRAALREHLKVHNGKLMASFESLYKTLHIAGYYHGHIRSTKMIKEMMNDAQRFIEKLS